jgi:hypothetical protein
VIRFIRTVATLTLGALGATAIAACEREPERVSLEEPPPLAEHCDTPAPPDGVATVQIVFSCGEAPAGTWRPLTAGVADTMRFALEALIEGPTPAEEEMGLNSFFSSATAGMLNHVRVADGVAYIDFQDFSGIIPNASTSAGSRELIDQIAGTVFQFDSVREMELSFNGSCEAFWNWLQRGCDRLMRDGA